MSDYLLFLLLGKEPSASDPSPFDKPARGTNPFEWYEPTEEVRVRHLRSSWQMAFKEHPPCAMCNLPILSGDYYERVVLVVGNRIVISRWHDMCPPKFFEEFDETMRRDDECHRQEEAGTESSQAA